MKSLLCMLAAVWLAVVQVQAMELPTEEDHGPMDNVCSGVMCRMYCPLGFRHGDDGCPRCSCIEDPCEEKECGEGEICRPGPHCNGIPCYSLTAECVQDMPCAVPMCANPCEHGYAKSPEGCDTCDCLEEPKPEMPAECEGHPCPGNHHCVAIVHPMCPLTGHCDKIPMCLPDAHGGMFLPHLPEHIPGQFAPVDLPEIPELSTLCKFRTEVAKKFSEEVKVKYGNSSMLQRILQHPSMSAPFCTADGRFTPLQCHIPDRKCWCVNDRGAHLEGTTKTSIQSKSDLPECAEHITHKIEGMFLLQHQLDDVEPHLINIGSVVHDHLAEWLKIDHAQILIKQVTVTGGGLLEVHFELHRSEENALHSAQLLVSWHMGNKDCRLPYQDTELIPVPKSLKMEHHTYVDDGEGNEAELPNYGLLMRGMKKHGLSKVESDFMSFYRENKIAVIVGGVAVFLFLVFLLAVCITVCKRARGNNNLFKHKRLSEKSKTYKENLAFANDMYGKQSMKAEEKEEVQEDDTTATDA